MPVIMVIGMLWAWFNDQGVERRGAGGLVLAFVINRAVDIKVLPRIAVESCLLAGMVLLSSLRTSFSLPGR